jgi:esterase/lipase superfamily enzyme
MPTNPPDPQRSFAIVDQAAMSEADFGKAVASQGETRRKKHKVLVFVHGFNNNFQESLFRLTQLQADAKIDGIPILFSWPSQGQVTAYEMDKEAASYSRRHLMALLTMLSSSPEVSDILLVAHSMGAMLTVDALRELRAEGINRVMARLAGVVLAAPDINAQNFRDQAMAIGPLKPPLLVLVSKDDGALRMSSVINGGVLRAGAIDVDDPVVQQAALKAKVQVVDISKLASHDDLGHDQFISVAVSYSKFQHQTAPYRNTAGTSSLLMTVRLSFGRLWPRPSERRLFSLIRIERCTRSDECRWYRRRDPIGGGRSSSRPSRAACRVLVRPSRELSRYVSPCRGPQAW